MMPLVLTAGKCQKRTERRCIRLILLNLGPCSEGQLGEWVPLGIEIDTRELPLVECIRSANERKAFVKLASLQAFQARVIQFLFLGQE